MNSFFWILLLAGLSELVYILLYGRRTGRKVPKGTLINLEALKLLKHPILWIYALPWFFLMRMPVSPVSVVLMIFVNCCLARHAMQILQQKTVRFYEPTVWMLRHCVQFCMSIFVISIFFLVSIDLLIRMANAHVSLYIGVPVLISVICGIGLVSLVVPIVATECVRRKNILFGPMQRSIGIVWNHVGVYTSMIIGICVYASLLIVVGRAVDMLCAQIFAWSGKPFSIFVMMLFFVQIVIVHTLFYYEFYVKKEAAFVSSMD